MNKFAKLMVCVQKYQARNYFVGSELVVCSRQNYFKYA